MPMVESGKRPYFLAHSPQGKGRLVAVEELYSNFAAIQFVPPEEHLPEAALTQFLSDLIVLDADVEVKIGAFRINFCKRTSGKIDQFLALEGAQVVIIKKFNSLHVEDSEAAWLPVLTPQNLGDLPFGILDKIFFYADLNNTNRFSAAILNKIKSLREGEVMRGYFGFGIAEGGAFD